MKPKRETYVLVDDRFPESSDCERSYAMSYERRLERARNPEPNGWFAAVSRALARLSGKAVFHGGAAH